MTTSTKSPVLVILPPTHKCPDLERVLKLARKAFDDVALNILDLNFRFAWVSDDELQTENPALHAIGSPPAAQPVVLPAQTRVVPAPALDSPLPPKPPARPAAIIAKVAAPVTVLAALPNGSAASATATVVPDARDCDWKLVVGNFIGTLSRDEILAHIAPKGVTLTGATALPPSRLGKERPETVRSIKLTFASKAHAFACYDWIKKESKDGGALRKIITPKGKIGLNEPSAPRKARTRSSSPTPSSSSTSAAPAVTTPISLAQPVTRPPAPTSSGDKSTRYRLTVGNLLPTLSKSQLSSLLIPPSVSFIDLSVQPLVQLSDRPDKCLYVWIDFATQGDAQAAHDWVRAESGKGGRIANLLVPKAKVVADIRKVKSSAAVSSSGSTVPLAAQKPTPSKTANTTPKATATSSVPATTDDPLPEASPNNYRLHVSNLKPDLELAQFVSSLVPRGVKLAGASLFAPRPMGGSRRELVRSLKFAFVTESDAKKCQQWIKLDSGGGASKVVLPGAKIVVGNPMDPMAA
ncbi:hypothetical protein BCR44DRAFT_76521 [Catenaria anguillulae PL171]|uniref:Uncharacterized protein n=1 Tax=Catenaria anguillulae PL171 TaxID=765915 RepID=A0A1Y2HZK6_9FUNG|nr:hypothetical protein BCR44DRAFT_76521 [Catenaria anguillulae PL171]